MGLACFRKVIGKQWLLLFCVTGFTFLHFRNNDHDNGTSNGKFGNDTNDNDGNDNDNDNDDIDNDTHRPPKGDPNAFEWP